MDDRNQIDHRRMWIPWAITALALVVVAFAAYGIGLRHDVVTDTGERVIYTRHGVFPGFFGIFLLFFLLFGLRRIWWWGGYGYYRPWRYRRWYNQPYDEERDWAEWHRREHERMDEARGRGPAPSSNGGSTGNTPRD